MASFSVTAKLDRQERKAIEAVLASINIGVPVDEQLDEKQRRTDEAYQLRRSLNALVGGDYCSELTFERALIAIHRQIEVCHRESDARHWLGQLSEADQQVSPDVATGPTHMAYVLAQTRLAQFIDAQNALRVVCDIIADMKGAVRYLPASEVEDLVEV